LHDFDVSGFSISGTLGTDGRRYDFENVPPMRDFGLRLADVLAMSLQSEPVPAKPNEWPKRFATLSRHGATPEEIDFLRSRRVELNAMTSRQFVDFIEAGLTAHGVTKLILGDTIIEQQARRVIAAQLTEEALAKISGEIAKRAEKVALPANLLERIEAVFEEEAALPWDVAVAMIVKGRR